MTQQLEFDGMLLHILLSSTRTVISSANQTYNTLRCIRNTNISKVIFTREEHQKQAFIKTLYIPSNITELTLRCVNTNIVFDRDCRLKRLNMTSCKINNFVTLPNTIEYIDCYETDINITNCDFGNLKHMHINLTDEKAMEYNWYKHALSKVKNSISLQHMYVENVIFNAKSVDIDVKYIHLVNRNVHHLTIRNVNDDISETLIEFTNLKTLLLLFSYDNVNLTIPESLNKLSHLEVSHSCIVFRETKVNIQCKNIKTLIVYNCNVMNLYTDSVKFLSAKYCILNTIEYANIETMDLCNCTIRCNIENNVVYMNKLTKLSLQEEIKVERYENKQQDGRNDGNKLDNHKNECDNYKLETANMKCSDGDINNNNIQYDNYNNNVYSNNTCNNNTHNNTIKHRNNLYNNIIRHKNNIKINPNIPSYLQPGIWYDTFNNNTPKHVSTKQKQSIKIYALNIACVKLVALKVADINFIVDRTIIDCTISSYKLEYFNNVIDINYNNIRNFSIICNILPSYLNLITWNI